MEITNPILLGQSLPDKMFILDINVLLNDNTIVNLEMQVNNLGNWPERSLGYLCRNFTSINKGDDYINAKTAIHIGFLDYTLFPERPEFHAVYKLLNEKNHALYTDKFILHVIELNYIHRATEEDLNYELDKWASLFKAKTWEEINMLAEQTPLIESAAETIYQLESDPAIQWLCEAHQASVAHFNCLTRTISEQEAALAEKDATIADKDATIADKDATIAEKDIEIAQLKAQLAKQEVQLRQVHD